eukprot:scaffold14374_cov208-Isochrysis_galbana.AAC.3
MPSITGHSPKWWVLSTAPLQSLQRGPWSAGCASGRMRQDTLLLLSSGGLALPPLFPPSLYLFNSASAWRVAMAPRQLLLELEEVDSASVKGPKRVRADSTNEGSTQ